VNCELVGGVDMRKFNVTGRCVPEEDYMVDINGKLEQIIRLVDKRYYFTINRARQYGKTTTLFSLTKALASDYTCINLSFEGVGETMFERPDLFCQRFLLHISKALENTDKDFAAAWPDESVTDFDLLSFHLDKLCKDRKIVLLIDEVDKAGNNQVFLHFLGMLRSKYLSRGNGYSFTFHSVILTGVYNIKNIKLKMIDEGTRALAPDENKIYNSPWNIAVDFEVDMSFSAIEISSMLSEYETDHKTGMDIKAISEDIYRNTCGYPFLVSRICQHIDEKFDKNWTQVGVQNAVQKILDEENTLFDDIYKNLETNANLYGFIYDTLVLGESYSFIVGNPVLGLAHMFGIIKNDNGIAVITNQIKKKIIYEYLISKEQTNIKKRTTTGIPAATFIDNGRFNMQLCLEKFAAHYYEMFNKSDSEFLEKQGRMLFITYLRPLINGRGFYHVESETRNQQRLDIVVDYG
jgi:hypothetical protein